MLALAHPPAPAPSLLDVVARAPGAAALIVVALGPKERKALRLAHSSLLNAVAEATKKLTVTLQIESATAAAAAGAAARPPTALRWPRLESLTLAGRLWSASDLDALGTARWERLEELCILCNTQVPVPGEVPPRLEPDGVKARSARVRTLAAAVARMPALRRLRLGRFFSSEEGARLRFGGDILPRLEELSIAAISACAPALAEAWRDMPLLRALHFTSEAGDDQLSPVLTWNLAELPRAVAASGVRLEELTAAFLDDAGFAALAGAPSFALRSLRLAHWSIGPAGLRTLAAAPWPLRELVLADCYTPGESVSFLDLAHLPGLERLIVKGCYFTDTYESLLCANLPSLTYLHFDQPESDEFPYGALSHADLFAGFPNLEVLELVNLRLRSRAARLLASRGWLRLRELCMEARDGELAKLARGACRWPALQRLALYGAKTSLKKVRRWAPRVTAFQR